MSKIFDFLFKSKILILFILVISIINAQDNIDSIINDNNDIKKSNEFSKINFINCDKFCSKFESTCPIIYNGVIELATDYIIDNKIIESSTKKIPFEIPKAFFL